MGFAGNAPMPGVLLVAAADGSFKRLITSSHSPLDPDFWLAVRYDKFFAGH